MAKRFPTKYPGVYYIEGVSSDGKSERIYYIKYRRGGKVIEEPVGRQFRDDMTPARASIIRLKKIEGDDHCGFSCWEYAGYRHASCLKNW